jgi:hypothetical protein
MAEIEDRYVGKARKLVLERFPEMVGAEASVDTKGARNTKNTKGMSGHPGSAQRRGSGQADSTGSGSRERHVVTFEKDVSLPGGHSLKRLVRVTMDGSGGVIRITSSK